MYKGIFSLVILCALFFLPISSNALLARHHEEMIKGISEIIKGVEDGNIPATPADVDPAIWDAYLNEIVTARDKLSYLSTGLPWAISDVDGNDTDPPREHCKCLYNSKDQIDNLEFFRIRDLEYNDFEREYGTGTCFMKMPKSQGGVGEDVTGIDLVGEVVGWHAQKVDDRIEDTVLSIKPDNALWIDYIEEASTAAVLAPLATIFTPFYCLYQWFFKDSKCDPLEAYNELAEIEPVSQLSGAIPGIGSITDSKYVGLWHMLHVERDGHGRYNSMPGTLIERAGPNKIPGALDMAVMTITDALGATVDAKKSSGVRRYSPYDEVSRTKASWQKSNLSHTEFTPPDKMALYGWEQFISQKTNASGLGFPLHVMGDMIIPHHLVGTMAWGHDPFENAIKRLLDEDDEYVLPDTEEDILESGYNWWMQYCYQNSNFSEVDDMVRQLARENYTKVGEWAWNDAVSTKYYFGDKDDQEYATKIYYSQWPPGSFKEHLKPLWINANGAALALLLCAAEFVPFQNAYAEQECPSGMAFDSFSYECVGESLLPPCSEADIHEDLKETISEQEDEADGGLIPVV